MDVLHNFYRLANNTDVISYLAELFDFVELFLQGFNFFQAVSVASLRLSFFFFCSIQFNSQTFYNMVLLRPFILCIPSDNHISLSDRVSFILTEII